MRRSGFTLIELLIAMILMIIILAAIAFVFAQTTETVNVSEARISVYDQARKGIDMIETDLLGCLPFNGSQRFVLQNGYSTTPGNDPTYADSSDPTVHVGKAADKISFRAVTSIADTIQQVEITYFLKKYGDENKIKGFRTGRPMFVLMRRVKTQDPTVNQPANVPWNGDAKDSAGAVIKDQELCHFVISFNIEYLANNLRFSQLAPSPCPESDPLGDGLGANDTGPTPYRISQIRITLTIVDDAGERQERPVYRNIWIPMG